MALGIISGTEVTTQSSGAPLDGEPLRRAALAKGRVAATAASDVAGVFQDVADKVAQNRQARQVFDADLTMRKTYDQFTADLVNNPDEGTWLPLWKDRANLTRDSIMENPHLGPDTKNLLAKKVDMWEETTTSATNIAALKKGVNESWNSASQDALYAAHQGQVDGPGGANSIMDAAVANHAGLKQDADLLKKQFPQIANKANVDRFIVKYPTTEEKNLTSAPFFKALPPTEQRTALAALYTAKIKTWKDNAEDMLTTKIDSTTGQIPDEVIKKAIDNRQIDPRFGENLIASQKRDNEKGDDEQYKYVSSLAHDPTAWRADKPDEYAKQLMQEAANIKSPTMRQRALDDINRELDSVHKEGSTTDKPVHKEQLEYMKQDFEEGSAFVPMTQGKAATRKLFGLMEDQPAESPHYVSGGIKGIQKLSDDDFHDLFGADAKRDDVIEAARLHFAQKQKAYLDWSQSEKGREATPEEAQAERRRLEAPDVEAHVAAALSQP